MPTIQVDLGYKPRAWQLECHRDMGRFTVVVVHRQAGKSHLAIMELIGSAMRYQGELGSFIYLAPLLKQAANVIWSRLKWVLRGMISAGGVSISESDLEVTFIANGAKVRLFGANNPDEIRGMVNDGIVIDEVAQIEPHVWDEIVQPTLIAKQGWALFIGTAKGINLFSELYFSAATKKDWVAKLFTIYDTDAIPKEEVERLASEMPPKAFAREMMCDFNAGSVDQLISMMDVEIASKRQYKEADIKNAPRIIGVDPARFGNDRSVIIRRQGLVAFPPIILKEVDNMNLAARVANEIVDWKPDAVFIDAGAGAGVIDRLRQLGFDVIEVPFGGAAIEDDRFVDRRSEMWWKMKEWLESGGQIPNNMGLKRELATPTYDRKDKLDRIRLEKKDRTKTRLPSQGSPDEADGLCLTFAAPVVAHDREREVLHLREQNAMAMGKEYDAMDSFSRETTGK